MRLCGEPGAGFGGYALFWKVRCPLLHLASPFLPPSGVLPHCRAAPLYCCTLTLPYHRCWSLHAAAAAQMAQLFRDFQPPPMPLALQEEFMRL